VTAGVSIMLAIRLTAASIRKQVKKKSVQVKKG
jgi:hypothetical protein